MKMTRLIAILGLALVAQFALAQTTTQRIRGTVTALDGNVLSVKTREGQDIKITLPDNVAVAAARAVKLADFKPDAYLGVTARINAAGEYCDSARSSNFFYCSVKSSREWVGYVF